MTTWEVAATGFSPNETHIPICLILSEFLLIPVILSHAKHSMTELSTGVKRICN